MGAYTWTFIRIDKINEKEAKKCIESALFLAENSKYEDYNKIDFNDALNDWLKMHKDSYNYFVEECNVDPKKLTPQYLTKQLKRIMKHHRFKLDCYKQALAGNISLEEVLRKTHQLRGVLNDFYVIRRNNHYYVHIHDEIFRNYEYCEKEFDTVEDLIRHCRCQTDAQFFDYDDIDLYDTVYHTWSKELEEKVRKFYSDIGDKNFIVQFG